jgi:uncharacterized cupin superfamily protein
VDVFNIDSLSHKQLTSKTGEIFSKSAVLTEFLFFQKLFVHHEILPPGKRASAPHSHTIQEEMIFVLNGYPTAHLGDRIIQLKPGDFIGFKPGVKELHFIENKTDKEVHFLVICSNQEDDQIIYDS